MCFQNYLDVSYLLYIQITNTILSIKGPHGYELSLQTCPISLWLVFISFQFQIPQFIPFKAFIQLNKVRMKKGEANTVKGHSSFGVRTILKHLHMYFIHLLLFWQ